MAIMTTVSELGTILQQRGKMLTTAESCTGGWIAQFLTSVAGSSRWFERGFVTYSNQAKQEMLGVEATTIDQYGAVSEQTAIAMAQGALSHSHGHISIATTGIAGPDGGTADKPVGLVWFAWALSATQVTTQQHVFSGERNAVRQQATEFAIEHLLSLLK